MSEQIIERGKVIAIEEEGFAKVTVVKSDACDNCDSMFCNPGDAYQMKIDVTNTIGAKVGDTIEFSIGGTTLLSMSGVIYGVPILIMIFVIYYGTTYFESNLKELISAAAAGGLVITYYYILRIFGERRKKKPSLPKIIRII